MRRICCGCGQFAIQQVELDIGETGPIAEHQGITAADPLQISNGSSINAGRLVVGLHANQGIAVQHVAIRPIRSGIGPVLECVGSSRRERLDGLASDARRFLQRRVVRGQAGSHKRFVSIAAGQIKLESE